MLRGLLLAFLLLVLGACSALPAQCPAVAIIATGGQRFTLWVKDTTVTPPDSVAVTTRALWDKILEDGVDWRRHRDPKRFAIFAVPEFRTRFECRASAVPPLDTLVPPPADSTPSDTVTPPPVDSTPSDTTVTPPPPPPVDTTPTPPPPPAGGYRFLPAERLAVWAALRHANHPFWTMAQSVCALTGTSGERYGDGGEWCAVVAVTTDDAVAAGKAIAKLKSIATEANANDRRENHTARLLMRDMLDRWMTTTDRATIDAKLTRWVEIALAINTAQYVGGTSTADSDQATGTGCAVYLHDLYYGTSYGQYQTAVNARQAIAGYVQLARGGVWMESSEYNPGTTVLLALCHLAYATATGQEFVPGIAQTLANIGAVKALKHTPDFRQTLQWGDEQKPRDPFRYKNAVALAAMPHPWAQWTLEQIIPGFAGWTGNQLTSRGLWLFQLAIQPQPVPDRVTWFADGMQFLYHRDAPSVGLARVMPRLGIHHVEFDAPYSVQVYRNGGWALTEVIGYAGDKCLQTNGVVYAGLCLLTRRGPVWADSGNGWAALGGSVEGKQNIEAWPGTTDWVSHGGRVVVFADVDGQPGIDAVITRDSTAMVDPRTRSTWPTGFRNAGSYLHQDVVQAWEGRPWTLWHAHEQPTIAGDVATWTAANGEPVTLRLFADQPIRMVPFDESAWSWNLAASEKRWQVRVTTDAPVLWSVVTFGPSVPVSVSGDIVTVGGRAFTVTSTGVAGP